MNKAKLRHRLNICGLVGLVDQYSEGKLHLKNDQKMRNCDFLVNNSTFEKVVEIEPQIFFDFRGGHTS